MADDYWVFGYGSLIWRPDFPYAEAVPARLTGYHRALCIYSFVHRGTPTRPGLVFGLDRGGVCDGLAFRVEPKDALSVRDYLRARELNTGVYREAHRTVSLTNGHGRSVKAQAFVVDRGHMQYTGNLNSAAKLALVRTAHGKSGRNVDYVLSTALQVERMGITDRGLQRFAASLGGRRDQLLGDGHLCGVGRPRFRKGARAIGLGPDLRIMKTMKERPPMLHFRKRLGL